MGNRESSSRLWPSSVRIMATSKRWSGSPVTRPAPSPSIVARPSSARPGSAKNETAASRDSTTMPTLSIRGSVMPPTVVLLSPRHVRRTSATQPVQRPMSYGSPGGLPPRSRATWRPEQAAEKGVNAVLSREDIRRHLTSEMVFDGERLPGFSETIEHPDGLVLVDTGLIDTTPEINGDGEEWHPQPRPDELRRRVGIVGETHLLFR